MPPTPPATGTRRIAWEALPAHVRSALEAQLGAPVAEATSLPGGFSEGVAARLRLATGRDVFLKAVSAATAPAVAGFHRREQAVTSRLPAAAPVPRLLGAYDDGTWVALLFEHVTGALPAQPWRPADLGLVLATATGLATTLTPSPVPRAETARPRLGGWSDLTGAPGLARVSPWAAEHLDELVALEAAAAETLAGDTLLHGDLYPFNVLLDPDRPGPGGVHVVDWPHAWVGAAHADVLTLMANAVLSGLDPEPCAGPTRSRRTCRPRPSTRSWPPTPASWSGSPSPPGRGRTPT
ncbi:phosphotransferase [Dactylosporangium sp. NPDC051485]|uniref:phosphotransferase family protein n=1 Tax=Dactylosporangium sp. NPDC051485 TaxID=3154846 RepID=UPI0034178B06